MENFQTLFLNYYIPSANKSIVDSWNQISKSKYKHLLNISKSELKENLNETIRLGYVGLFHKYEFYLASVIDATNYLLKELNEENNLIDKKIRKKGTQSRNEFDEGFETSRIGVLIQEARKNI